MFLFKLAQFCRVVGLLGTLFIILVLLSAPVYLAIVYDDITILFNLTVGALITAIPFIVLEIIDWHNRRKWPGKSIADKTRKWK